MTAPTVKGAGSIGADAGSSGTVDSQPIAAGAQSNELHAASRHAARGLRSPFTFEVHPVWQARAAVARTPAQDAASVRSWLRETVSTTPGARAPWLDLDRARVDGARLAALTPGPTLLLGMGGSALGARAALSWAAADGEVPHPVRVLDTVDPEVVREHLAWRERVGARVLVVSKSGTTIEVQRILDVLFDAGLDHVVFVADPVRTPMDRRFSELGCSVDRFDMPADVGGRYSVLTAVGQVPLRCAGLDPHALLDGAASLRDSWIAEATTSEASESASVPDASRIGDLEALTQAITFRLAFPAAVHVAWCYAERLLPYAAWLQQLDNESLGRHRSDGDHVGEILLPLRGPADQHSVAQLLLDGPRDKRVFFVDRREGGLDHTSDEEQQGALLGSGYGRALRRVESLRAAEAQAAFEAVGEVHPTARLVLPGRGLPALGAAFLRGMLEVVALGAAMGIDPYGQPAVEAIKRRIREG